MALINIHYKSKKDAKLLLIAELRNCWAKNDNRLTIIHGYIHGNVLQTYVRSTEFIIDAEVEGFSIKMCPFNKQNPGETSFIIEIPQILKKSEIYLKLPLEQLMCQLKQGKKVILGGI